MTDIHSESVEKAILNFGQRLNIKSLNGLECLYSSLFTQSHYEQVVAYIKNGKINALDKLKSPEEPACREYLELYIFADQDDIRHIATVYDSDELWQDPEVIDLIDH